MSESANTMPEQFGPYYLHELINSGGMSDIWLATNAQKEVFALRRLQAGSGLNFMAKKRFLRGCEVLQKMQGNELIIGYLDHGKIGGNLYMRMEYVEGANLKELFAVTDPLLQDNIATFLIEMAQALEHVHDQGYIHLDFKPENILISRGGKLKLIDFDLSIPIPEKPEKTKNNPGTPAYMSPEQLLREPIDRRADIFAYGVAAYELLTNQKPFPGETPDEILKKQLDRTLDFRRPRELNPDIPPALEKIILKCLEREMDKRYPFMSVLVRDLQAALYV